MKKTYAFSFNILLFFLSAGVSGADTLNFPLKIRIGADIFGPAYRFADKNLTSLEGMLAIDRDTSFAYTISAGYQKYMYSQYNYEYRTKGIFIKAGAEINTIPPSVSDGKYFAGAGIKYAASVYTFEAPFISTENYWGRVEGSIRPGTRVAHFLEASPGIRTEISNGIMIGWSLHLRLLIYSGTGRNMRPVYIPGYGNGTKSFSPGLSYYLIWSFRYRAAHVTR